MSQIIDRSKEKNQRSASSEQNHRSHRWSMVFHKGTVMWKVSSCHDVIMWSKLMRTRSLFFVALFVATLQGSPRSIFFISVFFYVFRPGMSNIVSRCQSKKTHRVYKDVTTDMKPYLSYTWYAVKQRKYGSYYWIKNPLNPRCFQIKILDIQTMVWLKVVQNIKADFVYCLPTRDDVIKWKHFLCYWPFVRGIHRSPVNSPHKGQWRGASMFSLICVWINGWETNREAGDLRRYRARYDVIVMHNH